MRFPVLVVVHRSLVISAVVVLLDLAVIVHVVVNDSCRGLVLV